MSKSLQRGILFSICVALVLALSLTLVFFAGGGDKNILSAPQGQVSGVADAAANAYEHGGNIGRTASGEPVTDASGFMTALRNNETINLQKDIILSSSDAFPRSAAGYVLSYSSTIYGNGHTISFTGRHSEGSGEWANPTNSSGTVIDWKQTVNYYGGIVGQLAKGGHIYDLNVVMTSGNIAFKSNDEDSGDTWLDVGGIAGIVESGASIENCTFTISQENSRLASLKWPETTMLQPKEQWGRAGGIAGELNGGSIINCTVTNNGSIEAGDSGQYDYGTGATYRSAVGNIVGWIGSGTIQNVRVSGSGSLNAFKVGNIGVLKSGSTISTQNFYNNFSGTFNVFHSTDGGSSSSAYNAQNGSKSATITNMFTENNPTSGSVTGTVNTIKNTSNIPSNRNYSVYFDPKQGTNYGKSLALSFNQTPSSAFTYTLKSGSGASYTDYDTIGGKMVFRGLPTSAATWNSSGNFTAVLESKSAGPQHRQPDLQPYEHGYTTGTPSGTPINDGSQFQGLFSRTGSIETTDTSTYYLTKDIVITGFTGKQFAGTLDGNGHTIYIAASDTSLAGHTLTGYNGNAVGGVIGALSGTIKNVRVVIDANITVGLNADLRGRVGGVVGRLLNGGSIENVQVIIPGDITLSYTNAGANDVSMGAVVGQATGASTISGLTVQMDGTLAPVGSYVWVSAVVGEIQAKSDHADTVSMNNIIVRGAGTFAAEATSGTNSGEPPYVSALATFNNNGENYPLVNLDGLIYDFDPTFSADGSAMYGLFVNNDSDGNTANYDNYVADSNLFIMQGREYTPTKDGTEAGNTYIPLDGVFKTVNTSVTGVGGATVAAYFMPGTGLVRLQVHSDSWGDERLTISGVKVDGKPIMSSLATADDSSSDRYFSVDKSTLSGLGAAVQVSLFSNVTDPTVQGLTYTGSPLDIVIDMSYNGVPLTAGDYSLSDLTAASGGNALVQDGKPLNAGEYSVTVTLNNPDHWFGIDGSGEASKTANVTFTVLPKNVTMQDPGDSMTAVYGEKYWILSDNNVWGLDEDLFFDEVVGKVEYTATVTRTDDGEGYASASGWLKAGSYRVALTINDSNYAINGNASVIYPLTITPVGLSYTLTVENSVAAVYDGNVRTISGTPQGGDGIISAAYEGSAGTAGDSVTAAVSVTYGGVAAQIQNAGDYVLGVALSGDDAENYTAVLTASWTGGGAIENNTVTVEKYPFTLQWSFDSNVALEYGDDITDDLIAETELFAAAAIPFNGGSFTGKISFNVVSAVYNGGTAYAPGVAAGTNVTFTVAPVLPDVLDENNYNISLSASGSGTKMVAQRTLTVNYDAFDMTAVYGDSISNEWLTTQYQEQIAQSITNIYNNDNVTFKIILYSTFGGGNEQIDDFSALEMGTTYMAAVDVDGNDNYTIPNASTNGYDFTLTAREISLSDITWAEDDFDGVYDGQAHALKAVLAEGSSLKEGDDGVLKLSKTSLTAVSDGGMITVTVASTFADKYTLTGMTEFTVTLDKKTLNILPYTSANFLDHDIKSLYAHLTNAESGLINGVVEGDTLTFGGTWATVPTTVELGGKSYVAAGSYTLNMNPPSENYQFDNNSTMSVTVNALDIGSAEVAVTWNENLTYNAKEQSVSLASVTVSGVVMPVDWFTPQNNTGTDADTYTATVAASNANITGSADAEFTISPASVTVKWEAAGEISVGTAMPANATDMSALDLTARVTEFNAPGITDAAQYSIVVTASGFDAGHSFAAGDKVTLTPSMTFAEGVKAGNYQITYAPETIVKAATAISVEVSPANKTVSVTYGDSVTSADGFISRVYFTIMSGAEGSALTPDNFTVTVTDENGAAVFGMHGLDAGTYTVTIEGKGAYSVSNDDNSFTYTVDPLTLTAGTWSGVDGLTYNGNAAAPEFEPEGVLDSDNVSFGYTIVGDKATGGQAINAGSYTVTAKLEGDDAGNYTLDGIVNVKSFTIAQMVLQGGLTVEPDLTYDGTSKAGYATWTWTIAPLKEGDVTANITFTKDEEQADPIAAGDYTAIVTLTDNTGNYDTTEITSTVNFTIKQLEVVLEWEAEDDLIYNGKEHTATATVAKKVGQDDVTVTVQHDSGDNVDVTEQGFVYVATGLTGDDAGNYRLPENAQSQAFKVTPAQVKIIWNFVTADAKITYGDSVDAVKALVNIDALDGEIPGVTDPLAFEVSVGEYSATTNAGTEVTFTVSYTLPEGAKANNYEITVSAANGKTLTVGKAKLNLVEADTASLTKVYDGKAVTLGSLLTADNVSVKGMKNGEDAFDLGILVINGTTQEITNVGEMSGSVTVKDDSNYTATALTVTYEITPQPIGVDWTDTAFTYNGSARKPTATATGLVGGDSLTLTVTGAQTNVGSYTATVKAFEQGNYKLEKDATVEFTISRKTVSVKWDDTELTYNGSAQKPTATVGEEQGLVAGDDLQITVSGEQTDVNTSGGSYTATAKITGGEDMGNYVLDESSVSTSFTIAPKPVNVTFTSDQGATINFDVAGSVTVVGAWTADGSDPNNKATLTLSDGVTDVTLTAEANEALPSIDGVPALVLLLDNEIYEGTPYGTEVKGGRLTVVSADKNYVFEVAQAITLNITPAISVGLQANVETKLGLTEVLKTAHNADYFRDNYLKVTGKDGGAVTGGTLEVTITPSEGLEEGAIKHAGTYTVKAVYTPAGAGNGAEKPTFSFEFIVTPVKVTSVTYSGEPLVYGDLSASGKIAVTVEYADGKTENVTAQYTSENVSTARYVKAGEQTIKVSYTNDDSDYAAVTEHEIKLTVKKKTITATIYYREQSGTELTLTYNGSGYTIGAELNGVLSGDGVGAEVRESFTDVAAYEVEITLAGIDSGNYKIEGEYTVTITPADVTYEWKFGDGAKITYGDSIEDVKKLVNTAALDGKIPGVTDPLTFTVSAKVNAGDYSATTNANTEVTFTVSYTLPEGATAENYNINITAANGNTLTVGKATLNLTIAESASLTKVYDGDAVTLNSLLTAGNVSVEGMKNGEDAFKPGILVINGTTQEITNVGEMSGSVTVKDDSNYTATALTVTYEITPKPIGVAWTNTEFTYDGTAHKPTATATELVGEDTLTLTVTGAQTNANAEGETYTATVKAFEQGNYKLESDSTQTFTIKKAAAALAIKDYDAIKASVYKGSAFVVTPLLNDAEDTQGIVEVKFADKTNYPETVAVQEIKNAGVYTVTLTVDNANYEYAQRYFTVTVSPKSIDVEWGDTAFTYNGSAQVPTATATGLVDGDSLTLTVSGAETDAGSYTATVVAFEQGNYKLESDITHAFTIAKADLTVTPASLDIRERETEVMQAFAEGEDLVKAFAGRISVSGVSGTVRYTVTIAGDNNYDDDGLLTVGEHTFTIDAGGNYNAASVRVTVIATPVVTVIASVEGELVYNGSAFEISYALKEGAPVDVSMDDITVTPSVETIVNAGEYKVTFTVTGSNEDYDYVVQDASGNAALTFTIARRGLDVAEVAEAVYGDLQVSGTLVTGTHTAFVAYNDEEIELIVNVKAAALSRAAAEYLDAGEYEVTIALANEQGNFSLNGATLNAETEKMEVESTLDVAPKTVTVGYTPSSPVYDAKGISITLDKFEGMLIEGDDPAVNIYINDAPYTGKVVLDAGEYTVRYESADPNYAFAPVSATFTIAPKSVTPNFDLNTGSGSQQITGGGKLEIEEGEETDIVAAIDNFMQSSGVSEEEMSIAVSGDLKLEDMATWAPGTYTVKVTLSGNHSGSMQFTVEVSEKIELPPPVAPELPETPVEAGSGNDWVLPLVIAIVALIDLALLVAIGVAAKKRA